MDPAFSYTKGSKNGLCEKLRRAIFPSFPEKFKIFHRKNRRFASEKSAFAPQKSNFFVATEKEYLSLDIMIHFGSEKLYLFFYNHRVPIRW